MISEVRVNNYRALQDMVIPIGPLTAFVGPNGVGKTSILRAVDLVLGRAWPELTSKLVETAAEVPAEPGMNTA